jgi:hypothetical protein
LKHGDSLSTIVTSKIHLASGRSRAASIPKEPKLSRQGRELEARADSELSPLSKGPRKGSQAARVVSKCLGKAERWFKVQAQFKSTTCKIYLRRSGVASIPTEPKALARP